MNKAQFKAIMLIANKLNWKSVNFETISQMIRNQQALELDTIGECDDDEETLLSIALWDADKITSTMYVSSYQDLVMWEVQTFCDDMGITVKDFSAMLTWESCKMNFLAPEYEAEDIAYEEYLNDCYSDFDAEMLRESMWIANHC